jgi:hypothetical protein
MKPLQSSTIIICGIVRDAERGLEKNIPVINALCDKAKDYRIVIYENDSRDTKQILTKWEVDRDSDKIHLLLNDGLISNKIIPSSKTVSCKTAKRNIESIFRCLESIVLRHY